ncbi:MAG: BrnT family toxin [Comamonadaceae bacterium]|nr:BrnT family toxin [Comamonadaceae bacterium]
MQIEFDPAKDVLNIRNHGLSLAMAECLEWDLLVTYADDSRHDYFAQSMVGDAPIGDTLYCVVFVERRPDVMRVISLRVADKKEVKRYAANSS